MPPFAWVPRARTLSAIAALALLVTPASCALIPSTLDCSDLQIGEELAVVMGEPVYAGEECGPAFGVVPGAEIRLNVEAHGDFGGCSSMIGPTFIPGVELTYDPEGSLFQSGGDPLASESFAKIGDCEGTFVVVLRHGRQPTPDAEEEFTRVYVAFRAKIGTGADCPDSCGADFNAQVTRR